MRPINERKELKKESLLALDDRQDRLNKRYAEITVAGEKIHSLTKVKKIPFQTLSERMMV